METGLYGLLQVTIVVCAAIMNGASRVIEGNFDTFDIVMLVIIPALTMLGLISIIDWLANRRRRVGASLFLAMGIVGLISISSFYNGRGFSYAEHPLLLIPHIIFALSWFGCGVLIWRGRVLRRKALAG